MLALSVWCTIILFNVHVLHNMCMYMYVCVCMWVKLYACVWRVSYPNDILLISPAVTAGSSLI